MSSLAAAFAVFALFLSAVGLYAVTADSVAQRTQEVGVRVALGAGRGHVIGLFVAATTRRLGLGLSIGMVGALGVLAALKGIVVPAGEVDYLLLIATAALLALVSLAATLLPATRALRVDPAVSLRSE